MSLFARAQKKKKKKSKSVDVSAMRAELEASHTPGGGDPAPAPSLRKASKSGWTDGADEEPVQLNFSGKTVTTEATRDSGPREEDYEIGDHRKRDEASAALRAARIKQARIVKAAEAAADGTAPEPKKKAEEPKAKGVWRPRVARMPLQARKKAASVQSEEDFPTLGGKKAAGGASTSSAAWGILDVPDEESEPEPEPVVEEPEPEPEPEVPARSFDNPIVGFEGEAMTEAELKAEGASMAREFLSVQDVKEFVLRANDARADGAGRGLMTRVVIEHSLEWAEEQALEALSEGLLALLEAGTLGPKNMVTAVDEVMEFFDDIMIDAPRADKAAALSLRGLVDNNIIEASSLNPKVVKKMGLEVVAEAAPEEEAEAAPAPDATAAVPEPVAAVPPEPAVAAAAPAEAASGGGGGGDEAADAAAPDAEPAAPAAVEEEIADLYSKKKKKKKKPKA